MEETLGSESPANTQSAAQESGATAIAEPKPRARKPAQPAALPKPSALLTATPESLAPAIEALLLSVDKAISAPRLAEALGLIEDASDVEASEEPESAPGETATGEAASKKKPKKPAANSAPTPTGLVRQAVELLNAQYEQTSRSFRIQSIAGGFRVMTLPKFAPVLEQYHGKRERHGVSRAALETLAIIAYKQPMTRASLEAIRGVACGEVLRSLIERRLVTIVGRAEELGRPMLYGTTKAFLETFGLANLKDLPTAEDLRLGSTNDAEQDAP